jgi:hypothetical protein
VSCRRSTPAVVEDHVDNHGSVVRQNTYQVASFVNVSCASGARIPNDVCVDQPCFLMCMRQVEPIWAWL